MTWTKCIFSAVVVDQETFRAGIQKRNVMEIGGRNLMDSSLSSGQLQKEEEPGSENLLLVCLRLEVLLHSFSIC
jgi:hypothetical protein